MVQRCRWVEGKEAIYLKYHDEEWGVPVYDDKMLFEMLVLESFSTGLSWLIILKKRENFREAFDHFDLDKIIHYDEQKITDLLENKGIVRSRSKILATISNAKVFKAIQEEFGSFSHYLWSYTNHQVLYPEHFETHSPLSDVIAQDLKNRGIKYFGTVTVYAYLQAVGVLQCHDRNCFKYHHHEV